MALEKVKQGKVKCIQSALHIVGFESWDSTHYGSKIFGKKFFGKFHEAKLEFAVSWQLFT